MRLFFVGLKAGYFISTNGYIVELNEFIWQHRIGYQYKVSITIVSVNRGEQAAHPMSRKAVLLLADKKASLR